MQLAASRFFPEWYAAPDCDASGAFTERTILSVEVDSTPLFSVTSEHFRRNWVSLCGTRSPVGVQSGAVVRDLGRIRAGFIYVCNS